MAWLLATETAEKYRFTYLGESLAARNVYSLSTCLPPFPSTHSRLPTVKSAARSSSAQAANGSRPEAIACPGPLSSMMSPTNAIATLPGGDAFRAGGDSFRAGVSSPKAAPAAPSTAIVISHVFKDMRNLNRLKC